MHVIRTSSQTAGRLVTMAPHHHVSLFSCRRSLQDDSVGPNKRRRKGDNFDNSDIRMSGALRQRSVISPWRTFLQRLAKLGSCSKRFCRRSAEDTFYPTPIINVFMQCVMGSQDAIVRSLFSSSADGWKAMGHRFIIDCPDVRAILSWGIIKS